MRFSTAASVIALAAAAYAQTTITVGQGGLKFDPQFVDVTANSVITFVFAGGNHSVSQSSFATPCEPLDGGFSSGFVPVISAGAGSVGTWNLTVTDATKPIWFYCAQGPSAATNNEAHCEAGMVGGINIETSDKTGDAYVSNAKAGSTFVQPTTTALSAPLAFASATPIITSGTAPASADTSASTGSQTGQSAGSSTDGAGSQTVTNTNTNTNTGPAGASNTNAATSASGGGSSTTTATGANTSTTNSGAGAIQASGFFAFLAAALGVAVL